MFLLIRKKLIQKKETNTVETDKKEDEKKTDDKKTEEQKAEDNKTDSNKTDNNKTGNNKTDNQKTEADKKTTESTGSNSESTKNEEHKHTWVTGYRTEEKLVHHDDVTHTETTYTTETNTIYHDGGSHEVFQCRDCGAQFTDHAAVIDHVYATEHLSGLVSNFESDPGWDEVVETQVPHTTTVVDQAAYDEAVAEKIEYTYCSECGAEK